ncbi:MAG TPA: helix-turn-helix domain-containing protein [Chloroflexota bacterium]|nr:helix-turn-helix domain-containing protein [Chloroflexota bacterium]
MSDRARLPAGLRGAGPVDVDPDDEAPLAEAGIVVRDLRTNERFWIHDTIIDDYGPLLGADTFTIYSSLSCMANKSQYCWPSLARLARHWGKGKGTVVRAIALLTDLQLIYVRRTEREDGGNSNNVYYLLEPLPIEEGLAALASSHQQRGASAAEAIERVLLLLPQGWEPLRRKKAPLKSRDDWARLLERLIPTSPPNPPMPAAELGESLVALPSLAQAPGGSMGELASVSRDWPGHVGDQAGQQEHWPGSPSIQGTPPSELGRPSGGTGLDLEGNPKDQIMEGSTKTPVPVTQPHQPLGGVLATDRDIVAYPLAEDEVLLEPEQGEGARTARIRDLVCRDIVATEANWGLRVSTECYYSAEQFLGLGGEEWTAEEERKRAYHGALRRDLEAVYRELGAFSIDEALASYFTTDLVARFHSDDPEEIQRLRGWLAYVRGEAGKGLEQPAGFLRSRIESKQWPPRGAARKREQTR